MILEMRRALMEVRGGNQQGYRKLFDVTYEEVYCRSLLIIQREEQVVSLVEDFYTVLFEKVKSGEWEEDVSRWFWQQYYQTLRKHYHKLLASQDKGSVLQGDLHLSKVPASFPLLHRIMLLMREKDNFAIDEISKVYGLSEDKIASELEKLEKALPSLVKDQPESMAPYLGNFKLLLLEASNEVISMVTDGFIDPVYEKAAKEAKIAIKPAAPAKATDDFKYFVADVDEDEIPQKPKKKPAPVIEEDDEEDIDPDEEDTDLDDEDEEEDDDHYDWDIEDDGKKMVVLGLVLAVIVVVVLAFAAFKFFHKSDEDAKDSIQSEEQLEGEDGEAPLIIKGDKDGEEGTEPTEGEGEGEQPSEAPEESQGEPETPPEEEQPQIQTMTAIPNSMNVRSEPNTSSTVLTTVKAGEKLEILGDSSQEWVQIRCIEQDNQEGYVMTQYLKAE